MLRYFGFVWLVVAWQPAGEISGSVVDARGGETLARVEILLGNGAGRTTTGNDGRFRLTGLAAGDYVLNASTVGYHLVKKPFHLDEGGKIEFDIVLSPDNFHQTDTVEAKASPFDAARPDSPGALVLSGNDVKNLGSVLADDPLRAVQSMPGVTSNNDFDARFSVRGADYGRIGLYVDGVLLHQPFHMIQGQKLTGSGSAIDGDMVDTMELHEGAFPARFGDRTGGVLDVVTRAGSLSGPGIRLTGSVSNAGVIAEGPFGKKKRGSWLVVARKSYLQYILARTFPDNVFVFGLQDVQSRLTYDLMPRHRLSLYVLESFSALDRPTSASTPGVNSIVKAAYHYSLANLGWNYTPTDRLLISNHLAWTRERFDDQNINQLPTSSGFYGEWTWNGSATFLWSATAPLEAGWSVRRMRNQGFFNRYQTVTTVPQVLDRFNGTGLRESGYLQQSWAKWAGRVRATLGVRWDRHSVDDVAAVSPSGSVSVGITASTSLQAAWGQYVQYPEIAQLTSLLGKRSLLPLRSNQLTAAIEQRFSARTRLRAEFYNRADRDLIFQPLLDARIANGKVVAPPLNPPYVNSLRGYSRGGEIFLQHSTANRLNGWVSYAFGRTGMRDSVTGSRFPADLDQRHTINVYAGYRLRPSVNLSLRSSYGSGFPIPAYVQKTGTLYYLSASRNQQRLGRYSRTDVRINKAWTHDRWKLTFYGEIINLANYSNYVFESFNGYNSNTRVASVTIDKMFPILPSVGLVFER